MTESTPTPTESDRFCVCGADILGNDPHASDCPDVGTVNHWLAQLTELLASGAVGPLARDMTAAPGVGPTERPDHSDRGDPSWPWQCYGCLAYLEALTEGFDTTCPHCGSYEIHLHEGSVRGRVD